MSNIERKLIFFAQDSDSNGSGQALDKEGLDPSSVVEGETTGGDQLDQVFERLTERSRVAGRPQDTLPRYANSGQMVE